MNKLLLLLFSLICLLFVQSPAKAKTELKLEPINLGSVFVQKQFPYEYQGKIEANNSSFDLCIFEFPESKDGYIYVGVDKESKLILFYHFQPKKITIQWIIDNFGEEFVIVPNGIVYRQYGFFAEINSKKEVVMVGRFMVTKDI